MSSHFEHGPTKMRLKNDILQFDKNLDLSTLPATILMVWFRSELHWHWHIGVEYVWLFLSLPKTTIDNVSYWISLVSANALTLYDGW